MKASSSFNTLCTLYIQKVVRLIPTNILLSKHPLGPAEFSDMKPPHPPPKQSHGMLYKSMLTKIQRPMKILLKNWRSKIKIKSSKNISDKVSGI